MSNSKKGFSSLPTHFGSWVKRPFAPQVIVLGPSILKPSSQVTVRTSLYFVGLGDENFAWLITGFLHFTSNKSEFISTLRFNSSH